jgi:hypothetical protein
LPDEFAWGIFELLDVVLGKVVIPRRLVGLIEKPLELERLVRVPVTLGVFGAEISFPIVVRPTLTREVGFDGDATFGVPKIDFLPMGNLDV